MIIYNSRWELRTPIYLLEERTQQQRNHKEIIKEDDGRVRRSHTNLLPGPIWNYMWTVENWSKKKQQLNNSKREKPYNPGQREEPGVSQAVCSCTTSCMVGEVTLHQTRGGKYPPKKDTTTTKTQILPESQHKWLPRISNFRKSRRLHQWVSKISYHRSSHHKLMDSEDINLKTFSVVITWH